MSMVRLGLVFAAGFLSSVDGMERGFLVLLMSTVGG